MLKQEEQKAWKKFDETKKRTTDILVARQRNMEIQQERQERQRQKEQEEELRQAQNRAAKEMNKQNVDMTRRNLEDKVRREVDNVKMEKREQRDFLQVVRNQEQVKNSSLKQIIKS